MIPFYHFTRENDHHQRSLITFSSRNNERTSLIDNFSKQLSANNFTPHPQRLSKSETDLPSIPPFLHPSVKLGWSGLNLGFSLYVGATLKLCSGSGTCSIKSASWKVNHVSRKPRGYTRRKSFTPRRKLTFADCRCLIYDEGETLSWFTKDFIMHVEREPLPFLPQFHFANTGKSRMEYSMGPRRLNFIFP